MNDCLKYSQRSVPGEEVVEPEVDLSAFLERQRLSPRPSSAPPPPDEVDDIDATVAHIGKAQTHSKKGRVQQIEWDEELENMSREKAAAEATRGGSYLLDGSTPHQPRVPCM